VGETIPEFQAARSARADGNASKARALYHAAFARQGGFAAALAELAGVEAELGNGEASLRLLGLLADMGLSDAAGAALDGILSSGCALGPLFSLSQIALRIGRPQAAAMFACAALRDGRLQAEARVAIEFAVGAVDRGMASAALAPVLRRVVEEDPEWLGGFVLLARVLSAGGDDAGARAVISGCLSKLPGTLAGLAFDQIAALAQLFNSQGFPLAAYQILAEVPLVRPEDDLHRRHLLGQIAFSLGELDSARQLASYCYGKVPSLALAQSAGRIAMYHPDVSNADVAAAAHAIMVEHRKLAGTASLRPVGPCGASGKIRLCYLLEYVEFTFYMALLHAFIRGHDRSRFAVVLCVPEQAVIPAVLDFGECEVVRTDLSNPARTAEEIAARRIDILIDTSSYISGDYAQIFVRHPAHIQVTHWFNIFGSYQDPCIDYLIASKYLVPEELDDYFSEEIVRMDTDAISYEPVDALPPVQPPPILKNGFCTFGALSQLYKISDINVRLWARVLREVPDARLVIGNGAFTDPMTKDRIWARFAKLGVEPSRIDLEVFVGYPGYLAGYDLIDLAFSTNPVAGGTTICEALWQGVPMLCLNGATPLGRLGNLHLRHFDCAELICNSEDEFVAKAAALARDPDYLATFRGPRLEGIRASAASKTAKSVRDFDSKLLEVVARTAGSAVSGA